MSAIAFCRAKTFAIAYNVSTIKHVYFDVSLAALPFTPVCAYEVQRFSPESRVSREIPVIGEPRLALDATPVSLFKADLYPRYISLVVPERTARSFYRAPSDGRRFAHVGCLISHPLDTFFIARLTISDNALVQVAKERKKVRRPRR